MKQIVILSGKGGTGKTCITAALAHLASAENSLVLADADVDASNLEILLNPTRLFDESFMGGFLAEIDPHRCTGCGNCLEVCRFGAVNHDEGSEGEFRFQIDATACEGCNSCLYQCPSGAIGSHRRLAGEWFISQSSYGKLFHAEMKAGEENSGKLVALVKNAAIREGESGKLDLLLVDGPPGIGCPVIAACTGADLALISTEPGVSAIHDLSRILQTVRHFGIKPAVCINRSDINRSRTDQIVRFCHRESIPVVGTIPYDTAVLRSMSHCAPVTSQEPSSPASRAIRAIWESLDSIIQSL